MGPARQYVWLHREHCCPFFNPAAPWNSDAKPLALVMASASVASFYRPSPTLLRSNLGVNEETGSPGISEADEEKYESVDAEALQRWARENAT
eukprot:2216412-Amphidinium_carterae.1